jgi:2-methylaconitate cis-trans-isomerase PrpF
MAINMTQTAIPYVFMRGGTSRGPYFNRADLPKNQDTLAQVLIAVVGSGHPLNIDGIGGGEAVTTKVAMLSESTDDWADIDYFFAQVSVQDKQVDFKPSCGNILSGVAPAAIEMGLIKKTADLTTVKIKAVNNGARIIAEVQTPDSIAYQGNASIDGVPGTGSPITLKFMDTVGGGTGSFLPTGQLLNTFDRIDVTCMDVAMPMAIARAESFGLTGYESAQQLTDNKAFMQRMEAVRLQAGFAMGLGDVSDSVVPKFGLLAPARDGGSVCTRYFMPWSCHPSMAVTGAQCMASCLLTPDSVAQGLLDNPPASPATIVLEHASGKIDVLLDYQIENGQYTPLSAGILRTARKLADGNVYVPASVW